MADFEDFEETAAGIALEIERKLVVLGIRPDDVQGIRQLAQDALAYRGESYDPADRHAGARVGAYGLIALMLRTMTEGAQSGRHISGNETWKVIARALWAAKESNEDNVPRGTKRS